ncbi:MAG: glycine zipper 2TM domain-containing protein [Rugosibacter sp.]
METTQPASRTHPLILAAAIAVIIACLAGVAALAGWLPGSNKPKEEVAAIEPAVTEPAALAEPAPPKAKEEPHVVRKKAAIKPPKTQSAAAPQGDLLRGVSPAPTSVAQAPVKCNDCGVVEQIRELTVEPEGSGMGGVAGGVVGGLLGNQVGQGRGRTAATVAGVVGGALAGNKIEKVMKKKQTYEVVVRYEDGTTQTFPSETPPAWREGDKVRLQNGVLISR